METASSQTEFQLQSTTDGFDTLYSTQYQQTFHSRHGALIETEHVFVNGSGVGQRLVEQQPTCILEVGFGTGLNFFITAQQSRENKSMLHYVALEKNLLSNDLLTQLNHHEKLGEAGDIRQAFLAWRAKLTTLTPFTLLRWDFEENIRLELVLGDAILLQIPKRAYHAIYHDAFSPESNPELWTVDFFIRLYKVLAPGGKLATYSVKDTVRHNLKTAGFEIEKQPGPLGKREMLVAIR